MLVQSQIQLQTSGRGTHDITAEVNEHVRRSQVTEGLCTVFVQHTSASLVICENADPDVRTDLEAWLSRAVPDGDPLFVHTSEGSDDMPAHVRSTLTSTSIGIPITSGGLALGTWQGLYLYEHRHLGHSRRIRLTILG
jgi:secondary thiamine-phosphate synthase enzyme